MDTLDDLDSPALTPDSDRPEPPETGEGELAVSLVPR
jgi:hypothetical protein